MTDRLKSTTEWVLFSPGDGQGFLIGEVRRAIFNKKGLDWGFYIVIDKSGGYNVPADRIILRHHNYDLLKSNLSAAMALEKQLRPAWQMAVEHELRVRNDMLDRVWTRARSLPE